MSSLKDIKLAQKSLQLQQQLINELESLVQDIERCEKTVGELQIELAAANAEYPSPRSTRQDIDYLTVLLRLANKKLVWEKNVGSLQKRTPVLLERMTALMDDPKNPPTEQTRAEIVRVLQGVQSAVERLTKASSA